MRYYIDTEFIEDGHTIDLVSIGLVSEDGREYYAQSVEFDDSKANDWVKEHVFFHLLYCPSMPAMRKEGIGLQEVLHHKGKAGHEHRECRHKQCPWRYRREIAQELQAFCNPEQYGKPEFIGWCAGYDWVALCQLFGTMMDIPQGWPHYIKDLQQVLDERGIADEKLPGQEEGLHNALADARHLKKLWAISLEMMYGSRGMQP